MPAGTRLTKILMRSARVRACGGGGLVASTIELDDADVDAGLAVDVSGEHRITATFAQSAQYVLSGPIAIDLFDTGTGTNARCTVVDIVDSNPAHAWTNETRFAFGIGFSYVHAFAPVDNVGGIFASQLRARYVTSERGALALTLGAFGAAFCRSESAGSDACSRDDKGETKSSFSLPIGVGYDYTLFHAGLFALGLGARYSPQLTFVALRSQTDSFVLHELTFVPRVALVERFRSPSGLPGASHGISFDIELPTGLWFSSRSRETAFVLGGVIMLNISL